MAIISRRVAVSCAGVAVGSALAVGVGPVAGMRSGSISSSDLAPEWPAHLSSIIGDRRAERQAVRHMRDLSRAPGGAGGAGARAGKMPAVHRGRRGERLIARFDAERV